MTAWQVFTKVSLSELLYRIFIKDYDNRIASAKQTSRMIRASTRGSINHFYNMDGEQIRGYSNYVVRTRKVEHPLMEKYH